MESISLKYMKPAPMCFAACDQKNRLTETAMVYIGIVLDVSACVFCLLYNTATLSICGTFYLSSAKKSNLEVFFTFAKCAHCVRRIRLTYRSFKMHLEFLIFSSLSSTAQSYVVCVWAVHGSHFFPFIYIWQCVHLPVYFPARNNIYYL